MRIISTLSLLILLPIIPYANTENKLTIGDKAPAIQAAGFVKGDKIGSLEKGKTYVIEFWATWCGPCIASMPHLSEMADKYRGKVDFISVNTWDYAKDSANKIESGETHIARIKDWVSKNTDQMRYHVVLDDEKEGIATNWLAAADRNGIPCAFIVNDEGNIAWIGHPMRMDKPLEEVLNKTWDLPGFKAKYDKDAQVAKQAEEALAQLAIDLKNGNIKAIDAYIASGKDDKGKQIAAVISGSFKSNPSLSFNYFKKYVGKVNSFESLNWCSLAKGLAPNLKNKSLLEELVKLSGECAKNTDEKVAATVYTYHATVLNSAGKKQEAMMWIEKARASIYKYEPASSRVDIKNYIDKTVKGFD